MDQNPMEEIQEIESSRYRNFKNPFLKALGSFLYFPGSKRSSREKIPWYDWILALLGLFAGLYIAIYYPKIVLSLGSVSTERLMISVMAVLLVLEAVRRILGYVMLTIVSVFIVYGYFASYMPGVFQGRPITAKELFNYLYLDPNSILNLLNIAATIALSFLVLGQILLTYRGADMLNNYAMALFGRMRGGPAKVSIIGSSLSGTMSGSAVTNVLLTGPITIPLMKKNGLTSSEAGAVESVASTGGNIMPPVMGVAAFVIAETLGVPYAEIALAALIPAVLYYLCLYFQVDLLAARKGLSGLQKDLIPTIKSVLINGWMIIPVFAVLIYLLFIKGYTPQTAGIYSAGVAVVFLALQKPIRSDLFNNLIRKLPSVLIDTGKVMLEIGVVLAAAGIVVGITGVTGLGFNMGFILTGFAEYGLILLLIMSAIASLVLGMGMPSVAAYSLVAVMVAPTLIQLGIDPIAAHLFVFYYAILSNFTPPIALACFAAAPIAKESAYNIGFKAVRFGITAFIVPFLFVFTPELLLRFESVFPVTQVILAIVFALVACYFLSTALEGFLFKGLNRIKRGLALIISIILFLPSSIWPQYDMVKGLVLLLGIVFVIYQWRIHKKDKQQASLSA